MKKQYITPATETIEINVDCMLGDTASIAIDNSGDILEDDTMVGSKGHNFNVWGTDEDEE